MRTDQGTGRFLNKDESKVLVSWVSREITMYEKIRRGGRGRFRARPQ